MGETLNILTIYGNQTNPHTSTNEIYQFAVAGFSTLTSEMTTLSITTPSTEEKENNFWLIM